MAGHASGLMPADTGHLVMAAASHVHCALQACLYCFDTSGGWACVSTDHCLACRGWGNLGDGLDIPDNVLQLDAVPHDWLLPQCSAVVHHGGAGTTSAGLLAECPTLVVPFFGVRLQLRP